MSNSGKTQGRIFWGLLLIALGVAFLFDQIGRIDFWNLVGEYWFGIFFIIGLAILISSNFRNAGSGIFFIVLGAFFLLMNLRIFDRSLWHYLWPLLIIGAGLWILFKPLKWKDKRKTPEVSEDALSINQVFSSSSRRIESQKFKGGKAEVAFGSIELDLSGAGLDGGQATLYLSAVFGSFEVRVPREWEVVVEGSPFLGSIEDKKRRVVDAEKKGTLTIRGSAAFGSIEIKD